MKKNYSKFEKALVKKVFELIDRSKNRLDNDTINFIVGLKNQEVECLLLTDCYKDYSKVQHRFVILKAVEKAKSLKCDTVIHIYEVGNFKEIEKGNGCRIEDILNIAKESRMLVVEIYSISLRKMKGFLIDIENKNGSMILNKRDEFVTGGVLPDLIDKMIKKGDSVKNAFVEYIENSLIYKMVCYLRDNNSECVFLNNAAIFIDKEDDKREMVNITLSYDIDRKLIVYQFPKVRYGENTEYAKDSVKESEMKNIGLYFDLVMKTFFEIKNENKNDKVWMQFNVDVYYLMIYLFLEYLVKKYKTYDKKVVNYYREKDVDVIDIYSYFIKDKVFSVGVPKDKKIICYLLDDITDILNMKCDDQEIVSYDLKKDFFDWMKSVESE